MMKILKTINQKYFFIYNNYLKKATEGCDSILDVGCGESSPLKILGSEIRKVGIDAFKPSIEKSKKEKIHEEYFEMEIMDILNKFGENSFDCILANDIIEHLDKEDGLKLLELLEKVARKRIIIFTPNGFVPQEAYENNPWQVHKSGWSADEMKQRGYNVIGMGHHGFLQFQPQYNPFLQYEHFICFPPTF